jgi:hypothetical protein
MERPVTPYGDEHNVTLSPPAPREEVHNRRISCNGFVRKDGQYDIEAEITDNKTYDFPSDFRGDVTPDQFIHHMRVRVTIDRSMTVTAAEAITISGPYAICPTANDVFENLVGLTIGPGWRRRVTAAIGGRHGCTHISELMGTVGTIAYQTRYGEDARRARAPVGSSGLESAMARGDARGTTLANSCIAYAIDE